MQGESLLKVCPYNRTFDKEEFNYKDNFYKNLVDVNIKCGDRIIGAHKFILANRSPFYRERIVRDPGIQEIEVEMSSKMTSWTLSLIYGENIVIKEAELVELTRVCTVLRMSFTVMFPQDIEGSVSLGSFPSDGRGGEVSYASLTASSSSLCPGRGGASPPPPTISSGSLSTSSPPSVERIPDGASPSPPLQYRN